jgi:lipopolysaccharide/colanic/teichoic acid biosynthesis glycosyltransferase
MITSLAETPAGGHRDGQAEPAAESLYARSGKRCLDIVCSVSGLIALSPLLAACALLVRFSSKGPIFYRQVRIGRGGVPFSMLKFRSMRVSDEPGRQITIAGDCRVTSAGRLLRASKLDELPQLWNVLVGDMSLVGPRPEVPEYVAAYTTEQRQVLQVRPGITDPASITYRHEEAVLAGSDDPERFYREVVMQHKLALNLNYVRTISLRADLKLVFSTVAAISKRS